MAGRLPESFLDSLRTAVPVIDAVARRHKMRKCGSSEYEAIDDPSLRVNTSKNIWRDFGKGDRGGDIFDFEMFSTGCTFFEAAEALAQFAGIPLPSDTGRSRANGSRAPASNGSADDMGPEPPPADPAAYGAPPAARAPAREITATYDYRSADDILLYQVCRQEWVGEDGRRRKTFLQRRPYGAIAARPEDQHWIWGLGAGTYLRGRNGDFYAATADRVAKWKGAERIEVDEVAHTLYRLPELREEMEQDESERRLIATPEGEKDCETLIAWGLCATTNSGGANNWRPEHAEELRDADVVVLADNDDAGRSRAQAVAMSLRGLARRTRVLDWATHWRGCPPGADVTDWRDQAAGTPERLFEIIDQIPDWSPEPPSSSFRAMRFADLDRPRRRLEWLIKSVLQRGEMSVWYGDWGTGKSFLLTDAGFAIARGVSWFGLRTRPGLVVYQVGEGEIGFGNRMEAYRRHNHVPADTPFVAFPTRINLHVNDDDLTKIIAELKAWSAFYALPLELFVVDTFSAATAGADENSGRDVGPVLERGRRIAVETGCHVAVVHHVPKGGSGPRGWSGFLGNVDSAVLVENTEALEDEERSDGTLLRRTVHQWSVVKQKDAESRLSRQFVLPQVVIGKDHDGDSITSCVVAPALSQAQQRPKAAPAPGYAVLLPTNDDIFRSLVRALRKHGVAAPPGVPAPPHALCCRISEWQDELVELQTGHEEITPALRQRIKMRIYRASKGWLPDRVNLINKHKEWVWRTDRKVHNIDPAPGAPPRRPEPEPILAPGENVGDITDLLSHEGRR